MTAPDGPRPPFVPDDFAVPRELVTGEFRLEPLGPQHNAGDYEAWTSSMEHIRATPGFAGRPWPVPMTLEDNLGDLRRHERDFTARSGFTYTVLAGGGDRVVGCVYIYPTEDGAPGAADAVVAGATSTGLSSTAGGAAGSGAGSGASAGIIAASDASTAASAADTGSTLTSGVASTGVSGTGSGGFGRFSMR